MGAFTLGNNAELGTEEIQALYIRGIKKYPKYYTRLYNVVDTDNSVDKDYSIQGLGLVPVKAEDVDLTTITVNKNGIKTYSQVVRAANMKITWELIRYGKLDVIRKITNEFAASFLKTMDFVAHLPFNNLLSVNALYVMPDGQPVASTAHVMGNGATQANGPAGFANALSRANVETELARIATWNNDGGLPLNKTPTALYCHSSMALHAQEILKSAYRPDWQRGAMAKNSLNDLNLEIIADPYIADTSSWGILCEAPADRAMTMYVSEYPAKVREMSTEANYDKYYASLLAMVAGISDWMDIDVGYCV